MIADLERRLANALSLIPNPSFRIRQLFGRVSRCSTLKHRREACESLSIHKATFWRHWHSVFTDPRSPEDQRGGVERKVYEDEDELAVAVEAGGGSRARVAVIAYRGKVGRK